MENKNNCCFLVHVLDNQDMYYYLVYLFNSVEGYRKAKKLYEDSYTNSRFVLVKRDFLDFYNYLLNKEGIIFNYIVGEASYRLNYSKNFNITELNRKEVFD